MVSIQVFVGSLLLFAFTKADFDCIKVLSNPNEYPLEAINHCYSVSAAPLKLRRNFRCPPFTCSNNCLLGWQKDQFGCSTCKCVEDGNEGKFEGDITLVDETREFLKKNLEGSSRLRGRGAARSLPLWKMFPSGNNYIVPYIISSSIGSSGRAAIEAAAKDFAKYTCIRLQPRTNQDRYINFYRGGGCSSPVGAVSTRQDVSLAQGCWYKGTVIHEVLHSLGFWHEQSRPDRDNYVRILSQNIPPQVLYNFNKFSTSQINSRGSAYDVGSVMHYNGYAFSSNGRPTITDLQGNPIKAQRNGFSTEDIKQLNSLYGCSGGTGGGGTIDNCSDENTACSYWAQIGECTRNPNYMSTNCCKSCKGAGKVCNDDNASCEGWSRAGFCVGIYSNYMSKFCKKSCKIC